MIGIWSNLKAKQLNKLFHVNRLLQNIQYNIVLENGSYQAFRCAGLFWPELIFVSYNYPPNNEQLLNVKKH